MTTKNVIRTQFDGCYEIINDHWGTRLQRTYDPEGVAITPEELDTFELSPKYVKIPKILFNKILSFFGVFDIEAQVILIRRENDLSCWDALIPRQVNTTGSVSADKKQLISLTTGKEYTSIPDGWFESGTAHSHPSFQAFWSGVDDASELKATGVHFTVGGNVNQFTICTSICIGGKRYVYEPSVLIDSKFAKNKYPEYYVVSPTLVKTPEKITQYVTQKVFTTNKQLIGLQTRKLPMTGWGENPHLDYDKVRLLYDRPKLTQNVRDVIEEYLLDGGDANLLREIIEEVENQIFSWGF